MDTNLDKATQDKIISVLEGIICSSFISGFISAHNQMCLFTLKRPLSEEEAKKLEGTAYASLNNFVSMYISNPQNKVIIEDTFDISLEDLEKEIMRFLKSKIIQPEEEQPE